MVNRKILYIIIGIVVLTLILLPIKFDSTIASKGKLLPAKSWTLSKESNDRLVSSLDNHLKGISSELSIIQFERGDAINFQINSEILSDKIVNSGDTIGNIISSNIDQKINQLEGSLISAQAKINVQTSSEKLSVIKAEESRLEFAEKELEEQTKIFNRKKQLYERNLISLQEFEADEANYELSKVNIRIAKERLNSVLSGVKEEEVNFTLSQIDAIEEQLDVLYKRKESNTIISPITGSVYKAFSLDTLLIINDTSNFICVIPVKWSEINRVKLNQSVLISTSNTQEEVSGKIVDINNYVTTINDYQCVLITVVSDTIPKYLKPGLIVDSKIYCGEETLLEIILNFLKPIYI